MTRALSIALLLVPLLGGCAARSYTLTWQLPAFEVSAADSCDGIGRPLTGPGWSLIEAWVNSVWVGVGSKPVATWGVRDSLRLKLKGQPTAFRVYAVRLGMASCPSAPVWP